MNYAAGDVAMQNALRDGERVRVLFADQLNLARGKYVPARMGRQGHARFCVGTYALTYARQLVDAPGAGLATGLPDMIARFDESALRPGWEPGTRIALGDLYLDDGPFGLCGRSALKKALAGWQAHGLAPMIGLEGEAYIFQRDAEGRWVPYDTPGAFVYGTGPFTDPAGLVDEIWEMAERIGIEIESLNSEFDFPQFELTLGYTDALKACDDFFLFRTMARELLYRRGYLLNFMPKPIAGKAGTGLHINISMQGADGGNAFAGGTARGALSPLVSGCIAGLVRHHRALCAIMAPTVNSYARLQPASLSGCWANWGHDHRGVAVRVSGETGPAARIEHRLADCAASPYVAVAAALQAALLGVEHAYPLQPEEGGDGIERIDATERAGDTLGESLDALAADHLLRDALGPLLVDNFIAIKRAEIAELADASEAEMFDYYAPFI
jgi:glutamine synthetase